MSDVCIIRFGYGCFPEFTGFPRNLFASMVYPTPLRLNLLLGSILSFGYNEPTSKGPSILSPSSQVVS